MIGYFLNVRWFLFTFGRPKPLAKLWRSIEGITGRPKVIGVMMSIGLVKLPWCHSEILGRFPFWRAELHQPRRRSVSHYVRSHPRKGADLATARKARSTSLTGWPFHSTAYRCPNFLHR